VALGSFVGYNETWAARAAKDLTRMCGRPVEVQNLGRELCLPICEFHRMDEALVLNPDLVVMTVAPYDLEHLVPSEGSGGDKSIPSKHAPNGIPEKRSILKSAQTLVTKSRAVTVVEHFLFQDPSTYAHLYLAYRDKADFLRSPLSPAWEQRLAGFELLLGEMAERFHAAHVPFVLIEMPSVAQVSVLALNNRPPKVDPYALNQRLTEISSRHGIQFVSGLDAFRQAPGSNKFFYMVDGHMNEEGHALVSGQLVDQLTQGLNPALSGCSEPQKIAHQ